jgi:hypothetical protein
MRQFELVDPDVLPKIRPGLSGCVANRENLPIPKKNITMYLGA